MQINVFVVAGLIHSTHPRLIRRRLAAHRYGFADSTFYAGTSSGILWPTVEALNRHLPLEFPYDDREKLDEMARNMGYWSFDRLKGCVQVQRS
jgi:hypothetical protein